MFTKSFPSCNPQVSPQVLGCSHASAVYPVLPDALVSSLLRPGLYPTPDLVSQAWYVALEVRLLQSALRHQW
jgi:hypothetical protein